MADATPVAVIGAGTIGGTLTRRLRAAGRTVTVGVQHPSKPGTLALAEETGATVTTAAEAVRSSGIVVVAVPGGGVAALADELGGLLSGPVVVDATNSLAGGSMNARDVLVAAAPDVVYARAFNTLGWENFADPHIGGVQADLLWCGPEPGAGAEAVEQLIADVGLHPVRVGGLDQLDTVDAVARLWFALALGQGLGRHLAFKVLRP